MRKFDGKSTVLTIIWSLAILGFIAVCFAACGTQRDRVEENLTQEADNFNIVRRLTVINCVSNDTIMVMEGRMSINADVSDNQLEMIVERENKEGKTTYEKHFVGLSPVTTYLCEDLNLGKNEVKNYKFTVNFNPKFWLPYNVETIE